jgi:hypothetical protein
MRWQGQRWQGQRLRLCLWLLRWLLLLLRRRRRWRLWLHLLLLLWMPYRRRLLLWSSQLPPSTNKYMQENNHTISRKAFDQSLNPPLDVKCPRFNTRKKCMITERNTRNTYYQGKRIQHNRTHPKGHSTRQGS